MSAKSKTRRKQQTGPGGSASLATLTFELPAAEELLELAIQGRKWRQLVRDFEQKLSIRSRAKTDSQIREEYRLLNFDLRQLLANAGLSIADPEWLEQCREKNLQEDTKALEEHLLKQHVAEAVAQAQRENEVI